MELIKTQKIDKVEFVGDWKRLQVRHKIDIKEDDAIVSSSYYRNAYDISTGIAGLPAELQPYATGVWTDELVAEWNAYEAKKIAEQVAFEQAAVE
jgi:hypothetical protein